jgi:uncharacterized membrane protein
MDIRRPLIISIVLVLAMTGLSVVVGAMLPATLPLRFNAHGVPTAYGSSFLPLALMPVAALALSALFAALSRLPPRRENLANSRLAYTTRWIGAVVIVAIVHVWIVYALFTSARGIAPLNPARLFFALAGAMTAIVGSQLARVRSNFVIGIRTPWTLASDQVWERTHRLGRWPVIAAGVAILIAAFAAPSPSILLTLTLTIFAVVAAALIALSYVLSRSRDEQQI